MIEDENCLPRSCWNLSVFDERVIQCQHPIISLVQFVADRERISFVAFGYGTVAAAALPLSAP